MMESNERTTEIIKNSPTIFPFGLGLRRVDNDVVIIEFIDADNGVGDRRIISSIALPKGQALNLAKSIQQALQNDETSSDS